MAYQGKYDGLCGPYAIVNAYNLCGVYKKLGKFLDKDPEDVTKYLFGVSCSAIKGWPQTLWDGTKFRHMEKMLSACQEIVEPIYNEADHHCPIKVKYPFRNKTPRNNEEYWRRFKKYFERHNVICGIVGMEYPHNHWLTFRKCKKTLDVYDSTHPSEKPIKRLRIADIYAGKYRKDKKDKTVIARKELIVFVDNAM